MYSVGHVFIHLPRWRNLFIGHAVQLVSRPPEHLTHERSHNEQILGELS